MSRQIYDALLDEDDSRPLCLVGSGSAVCYLIDAVQEHLKMGKSGGRMLHVLYSCRDAALFRYVVRLFERLLTSPGIVDQSLHNLEIVLGLTDDRGRLKDENAPVFESERDEIAERLLSSSHDRFSSAVATTKNVNKFTSALQTKVGARRQQEGVENFDKVKQRAQELPVIDCVLKLKYGRIAFVDVLPKQSLIFVQVQCAACSRVPRGLVPGAHQRAPPAV